MRSIAAYKLLLTLAAIVLFLDQATKVWIHNTLPFGTFYPPDAIEVVPGFFNIVYVGNTGAAWSMFSGNSEILAGVGIIALILIFVFRNYLHLKIRAIQWAFGFIIGGIIGNVIDRFAYKYVVDFLDFKFGDYHFPAFNVADSGITVGATLFIAASFFSPEVKAAEAKRAQHATDPQNRA